MKINFTVNSIRSHSKHFLNLDILNNGDMIKSFHPCPEGLLDIDIDLQDQDNVIKFIITGKLAKYTISQNQDTALIIKKISLLDNDLLPKINLFSNYYTEKNGTLRTFGYMGFNGEYVFKIRYPISKHLLLCDHH